MSVLSGVPAVTALERSDPRAALGTTTSSIDADHAGGHPGRDLFRPPGIPPDARRETEPAVIGEPDRVIRMLDGHHAGHRPEGLLAHDVHVVSKITQHGEGHEVPLAPVVAAVEHRRAILDRRLDLPQDVILLPTVDHRPDLDAFLHAGSLLHVAGPLDELLGERVGDRRLDVDPLGADTDLAGVAERVAGCEGRGAIEVRTVQDHHRILAAEFEDDPLQTTARLPKDVLPGFTTSREHHEVDRRFDQRPPLSLVADHQLEDVGRQHLVQDGRPFPRDQRRLLAGLEQDRVARDQGRNDRLEDHEQREVPRRDRRDDPVRVEPKRGVGVLVLERLGTERLDHRVDLVRDALRAVGRFPHALRLRLAHLTREELADPRRLLHEPRDRGLQDLRPLFEGQGAPAALGEPGVPDHLRNSIDGGDLDLAHGFAGRGIEGDERLRGKGDLGSGGVGHVVFLR